MSYAPIRPTLDVPPTKVADDTWLIRSVQEAADQPVHVFVNSMVILGVEPIVVDTGTIAHRAQWLEDLFWLLDPEDVRWIFLSHDDIDHTGNLEPLMAVCPNARLVCSWTMVERYSSAFELPLHRCHWLADGEALHLGDRTVLALRPPVYDAPATRGLFDPTTGVYWAADAFATPLPDPAMGVADLPPEVWADGLATLALGSVSPWLSLVDPARFGAGVDRVQRLGINTIAGGHTPPIQGAFVDQAFAHLRRLPSAEPGPLPDRSVLDQVIQATSIPAG